MGVHPFNGLPEYKIVFPTNGHAYCLTTVQVKVSKDYYRTAFIIRSVYMGEEVKPMYGQRETITKA
jgi:hypothetical protein